MAPVPMKVLVINVGSTSIKYRLYEMDREETLASGVVERVGSDRALHRWEVGPRAEGGFRVSARLPLQVA